MWIQVAIAVAMMVVSYLIQMAIAPTPDNPTAGDLDVPSAETGGNIPVAFGTNIFKTSNVIWYGDARVEEIKKSGGKK
jgi:hypothetical protein